ncbi:MAG: phosphosulfolactate synthase [Prolixibacteraceae bacterium]|nr:phosphosulfolactate synthase [Prolixibacteraceae bacterium]
MNFNLSSIPKRAEKPRQSGITMVMDKGLSLQEARNLCEVGSEYIDLLKLGFGTGLITPNLKEKIKIYQKAGLNPYFGGTMFEAFIARNKFEDYRKFVAECGIEFAEVSDGVLPIEHNQKCKYIEILSKELTVVSEVGTKLKGKEISDDDWVSWMESELQAGAYKVIAEARESGNIGIYHEDGSANLSLIENIREHVSDDKIIWEAPLKNQQVWFIKLLGANVNLGNISNNEIIALEALRNGLRGDTLLNFLD